MPSSNRHGKSSMMMRFAGILLSLTLGLVGVATATPGANAATSFRDVPPGTMFRAEIMWLADRGVSQGWPDGTYRPLQPVARDAMAAFMYRLSGSPAYTPTRQRFKDVPPGTAFYKEISWLADRGISTGYPDGTYRPLDSVNRDAMAAFMYRLSGKPSFTDTRQRFWDVPRGTAFYNEINWLAARGISTGYPDGGFKPLAPVNRDAMAAFMYRLWQMWERDATPHLTGLSPQHLSTSGGARVIVRGYKLSKTTSVLFGDRAGTSLSVISDTEIHVTAPAGPAGNLQVKAIANGRTSNSINAQYLLSRLDSGAIVSPQSGLVAANGAYRALLQASGALTVTRLSDGATTWSSNSTATSPTLRVLPDGNVAVVDGAGTHRWSSTTHGYPGSSLTLRDDGVLVVSVGDRTLWQSDQGIRYDRLLVNEGLRNDQYLYSPNHQFTFVMQGDGNLVLYRQGGAAVWASGTSGADRHVVMQSDGNLVIYGPAGVVWASNTAGRDGATLRVQDDGVVVIYHGSTAVWSTGGLPGAGFLLPFARGTRYYITQGPAEHARGAYPDYNRHAVDFAMDIGVPILASADGTIAFEGYGSANEIQVRIDHGNDRCTQYAHLSRTVIDKGMRVTRGQLIGYSGNTGISAGPHLHWNMVYCSNQRSREVINSQEMGTNYPVGLSAPSQNG